MAFDNSVLRFATPSDAEAILEIYAPYILETAITFEYSLPPLDEYTSRIENILNSYPFFVCQVNNEIVGYAYAHQFRERAAYQWDIETSVYVKKGFQRRGIATLLYTQLLDECRARGYHNAYAGITIPNEQSVYFHRKMGFTHVGVFANAGFKKDAWYSVLFMEQNLRPCNITPLQIRNP